jgi:hypothetical protein
MNRIGVIGGVILLALAAPMVACTWVPLTDAGKRVRILSADEDAGCQKIGRATAKTRDQVALFARNDRKVREELEALGRNEAAELGGNAIAPLGEAVDGRQSFEVYRCGSP